MGLSVVILAGGKSSRMGQNKALLPIGGKTFLEHLLAEFQDVDDLMVSVDSADKYAFVQVPLVVDRQQGIGPIEGIYQSLLVAKHPFLFATAVDMPLLHKKVLQVLEQELCATYDAYFIERDGHVQTLAGIYSKRLLPALQTAITNGNYRILSAIDPQRIRLLNGEQVQGLADMLVNVNTPEEYENLADTYHL